MTLFRSQVPVAAADAFDAADALDAHLEGMYRTLEEAAAALSEDEYARAVATYTTAADAARAARERFDALVEDLDPAHDTGTPGRYATAAADLTTTRETLDVAAATLTGWAQAPARTHQAAGDLAQQLAQLRSASGAVPDALREEWEPALSSAQAQLNAAADLARDRRWLAALDLLTAASQDVAGVAEEVAAHSSDVASRLAVVADLAAAADRIRVRGTQAVTAWQTWAATHPGPEADQLREKITVAGAVFSQVSAAVTAWNTDLSDASHDLGEVAALAVEAERDLDSVITTCAADPNPEELSR